MTRFAARSTFLTPRRRAAASCWVSARRGPPCRCAPTNAPATSHLEPGAQWYGCHAELRPRLAKNDAGNRVGRGSRGRGVRCRHRDWHSKRQAERMFSTRSLQPSRTAPGSDCRSPARSSKPMAAGSGRRTSPAAVRCSALPCHWPEPRAPEVGLASAFRPRTGLHLRAISFKRSRVQCFPDQETLLCSMARPARESRPSSCRSREKSR